MNNAGATAHFWDRSARKYAASPIKDLVGYERTIDRTRSYLKQTDRVLELGCGTGTTALKLAPSVAHLTATDVSSEMIAIASEKGASYNNVTFQVNLAEQGPFEPSSYDAVLAFNLLHLVTRRDTVLSQVYRCLRPGGLFLSKTPCLSELNVLMRLAIPMMKLIGLAPEVDFFTAEQLEADLVAAGFVVEERAHHGSESKDMRIFLAVRKPT